MEVEGAPTTSVSSQRADYVVDTDMLRRAAKACHSIQKQPPGASREWFGWVPKHLEWLADQIDRQEGRTDG